MMRGIWGAAAAQSVRQLRMVFLYDRRSAKVPSKRKCCCRAVGELAPVCIGRSRNVGTNGNCQASSAELTSAACSGRQHYWDLLSALGGASGGLGHSKALLEVLCRGPKPQKLCPSDPKKSPPKSLPVHAAEAAPTPPLQLPGGSKLRDHQNGDPTHVPDQASKAVRRTAAAAWGQAQLMRGGSKPQPKCVPAHASEAARPPAAAAAGGGVPLPPPSPPPPPAPPTPL
jgi:hypothetical protein